MRTVYETERDRTREAGAAARAARAWRCIAHKLPRMYCLDYGFFRGRKLVAWVEVKSRRHARASHPPRFLISAHKWDYGLSFAERFGAAFVILVEFADGELCYWVVDKTAPVEIEIGGRKDRNDAQDQEPVVFIPLEYFKPIKEQKQ